MLQYVPISVVHISRKSQNLSLVIKILQHHDCLCPTPDLIVLRLSTRHWCSKRQTILSVLAIHRPFYFDLYPYSAYATHHVYFYFEFYLSDLFNNQHKVPHFSVFPQQPKNWRHGDVFQYRIITEWEVLNFKYKTYHEVMLFINVPHPFSIVLKRFYCSQEVLSKIPKPIENNRK